MDAVPSPEPRHLSVSLASSPTAPREARRAIAGMHHALPDHLLEDLQLIASELVTNSVVHAGLSAADPIELRVHIAVLRRGPVVRVSVVDQGAGFDPPRPADPGRARQWGLHLVERLSSGWGVESTPEGTAVWAVLPVAAGAPWWRTG